MIEGVADFEYDFYLLAIVKLLNNQYSRLLDFYFHTLIQQRLIEEKFLEDIAQSIFPEKVNGEAEEYRCFFRLRFDRKNYRLENKRRRRDENTENSQKCEDIASLMAAKYFPQSDIQRTQKKVIEEIVNLYKLELESDKQDSQSWINVKQGQKGIWKQVYDWLWDYKFPRWELDHLYWEPLKQKVDRLENWIDITPVTLKNWDMELPKVEPLRVGKPLFIWIQLPQEYPYLLLLNRGLTQRCFLYPSYLFAPQYQLAENPIRLPQPESVWYKQKGGMTLNTPGIEEFVAIALKEVLEFDWLKPRREEPVVNWTSDRLHQLEEWLDNNPNSWQGCYQKFTVM